MRANAATVNTGAGSWQGRIAALALLLLPFAVFWPATIGRVLFAPSDAMLYFFPFRVLTGRLLRNGSLPLWNPYLFSGVPYLAEIQTAVLYPAQMLFLVLPPLWAMNLQMITTYSIAALGTFAYTRAVGCSVPGATFGGLTFAFSGFMIGHMNHTGMIQGVSWLPVLLWSLEHLRRRTRVRYVAVGGVAVALSVFAGHPQMPLHLLFIGTLYGVYFALIGGAPIGRWRYAATAGATLIAGVLLSAVQLLPTAELIPLSVRRELPFTEFVLFSLPLAQLPMLVTPFLFGGPAGTPYWGAGGYMHEMLGYVGLIPLMLVLAAAPLMRRDRWTWFWAGLAAFAFLMTLGPRTPLAWVMYHVPVYNLFRVAGRHYLEVDFAMAVLAAWSLTQLPRVAKRWPSAAALGVAAIVLALVAVAAVAGRAIWGSFAAATIGGFDGIAPAMPFELLTSAIALPAGLAVASALAVLAYLRRPCIGRAAFVVAMQAVDLWSFAVLTPNPSPPAAHVQVVPEFVRQLHRIGTAPAEARVAVASAGRHITVCNDAGLFDVALVNGYEPLMMGRYSALTGMTYYGTIGDELLATRPQVLDLLNARYLAVTYPGRVSQGARYPPRQRLDLELRAGGGAEFVLPLGCPSTALELASAARGRVADGTPIARWRVVADDGSATGGVMVIGQHTGRWDGPSAGDDAAGGSLEAIDDVDAKGGRGRVYRAALEWDRALAVQRVSIEPLHPAVTLRVSAATLKDARDGATCPLTAMHALSRDGTERWERVGGSGAFELLRNRDSMPRAWMVPRTRALVAADVLSTIHSGMLPDGSRFDPRDVALVEGAPDQDWSPLDPAAAVEVTAWEPNAIELQSRSATAAFLVLSEIYYPGWKAEIDSVPASIVPTNYVLRGLALPPGEHRIRFSYRPHSVAIGAAISATTGAALLAAAAIGRRRGHERG